jgi:hypothetical protein
MQLNYRGQDGTGWCSFDGTFLGRVLQRRIDIASLLPEDVVYFYRCDAAGPIVHAFNRISLAGVRSDYGCIRFLLCTRATGPARCSVTFANSSTKLPVKHSIPVATV